MATPHPQGLVVPGNLSIWDRPTIQNDDGTHSSELSFSREEDGQEVLVPTIVRGKFLTPDGKIPPLGHKDKSGKYIPTPLEKAMQKRAWAYYQETGEHLGKFDSVDDADAYAEILHNRGEPQAQSQAQSKGIVRKAAFLHANQGATEADWNSMKVQLQAQGYEIKE
jgi:hypothetical protein